MAPEGRSRAGGGASKVGAFSFFGGRGCAWAAAAAAASPRSLAARSERARRCGAAAALLLLLLVTGRARPRAVHEWLLEGLLEGRRARGRCGLPRQ